MDEYGQPIAVQMEGRKGPGHRRRQPCRANDPRGRHWEALRAMGLMQGEKGQGEGYSVGWVMFLWGLWGKYTKLWLTIME